MRNSRIFRNVVLGIKTLMLHKLRSALTMLGVVFGVGSVIAMLAVGEGASASALEQIRKLGSENIILTSVKPSDTADAGQEAEQFSIYGLYYDDNLRLEETFPTVVRTVPARHLRKEARMRDLALELRVVGTTPAWFELVDRPLIAGRVFNEYDMARLAPVCVLTEHGARRLLATEATIGQSVRIGGAMFEVIGIVQSESTDTAGGAIQPPDQPTDVYLPLNVCRARFGEMIIYNTSGNEVRELVELHQIIVQVDSTDNVEPTAEAIEGMLARFHDKDDYDIGVPLALLRQAEATKRTFNIVLGSIAGISLLVGGIGIMNIMLASVTERTREIGIRRAIGAKRGQIVQQFLIETIVLSTIGGMIGLAVGVAIPTAVEHFAGMPTVITPWSLLLSVGISVGVGVVFGLYPAVRASQLDPIVALRHE